MLSRCKLFKIGQDNKLSIPLNIIILYLSKEASSQKCTQFYLNLIIIIYQAES